MANKKRVLTEVEVTAATVPSNQAELQNSRPFVYALLKYTEGTEASVDIGYEVRPDNDSAFAAADWFPYTGPPTVGSGITNISPSLYRFTPTGVAGTIHRACVPLLIPASHMVRLTVLGNTPGLTPGNLSAWIVQSP